ncbi:MAG TPA: hypothetical protein VGI92_07805 [Gemmatimonadales bacterium]
MAVGLSLLSACSSMTKPPQDLDAASRRFIGYLAAGRIDSALAHYDPAQPPPEVAGPMATLGDSIRPFQLDSVALVGWQVNYGSLTSASFTYELHTPGRFRWSMVEVSLRHAEGSPIRVLAASWNSRSTSLRVRNRFDLSTASYQQYLFLLITVACFCFCIAISVMAGLKHMGWRWTLFPWVGVVTASFNWTSQVVSLELLHLQIFGAGFSRAGLVGPWILSASFPLGAILTLRKWRKLKKGEGPIVEAPPP